jgi:hypothetical protein
VKAESCRWFVVLWALACSGPAEPVASTEGCSAPEGLALTGDVESLRIWINALPKPTTLACVLESLPRPLRAQAAQSELSAQPSNGAHNPRVFLFHEPLLMTVIASGTGSPLLELSVLESETRSIKAEIHFPVGQELPAAEPYEQALFDDETTGCAFCHADERPVPEITFARAFSSEALKPDPLARVAIDSMLEVAMGCDAVLEPERCQMLSALFARGPVVEHEFPAGMRVCFGG